MGSKELLHPRHPKGGLEGARSAVILVFEFGYIFNFAILPHIPPSSKRVATTPQPLMGGRAPF